MAHNVLASWQPPWSLLFAESDRGRFEADVRKDSMMWLFDGATGAEYESTFGFWKQDLFPLEIANKLENWPIEDQEQRPQMRTTRATTTSARNIKITCP